MIDRALDNPYGKWEEGIINYSQTVTVICMNSYLYMYVVKMGKQEKKEEKKIV